MSPFSPEKHSLQMTCSRYCSASGCGRLATRGGELGEEKAAAEAKG